LANFKTRALTEETFAEIVTLIKNGFHDSLGHYRRPNEKIATVLTLEANLGMRISDILQMRLNSIIRDGGRYRLDVIEQKTGKLREYTVPNEVYIYIQNYVLRNKILETGPLFDMTERQVQKHLKYAVDKLGYPFISTHSFRKYFATSIYVNNNYNILLVKQLLQHASVSTTQRYLTIGSAEVENALQKHVKIPD